MRLQQDRKDRTPCPGGLANEENTDGAHAVSAEAGEPNEPTNGRGQCCRESSPTKGDIVLKLKMLRTEPGPSLGFRATDVSSLTLVSDGEKNTSGKGVGCGEQGPGLLQSAAGAAGTEHWAEVLPGGKSRRSDQRTEDGEKTTEAPLRVQAEVRTDMQERLSQKRGWHRTTIDIEARHPQGTSICVDSKT